MVLETAADALLWLLHALLRERWQSAEGAPNQVAETAYEAPVALVRVRGLRVQQTLFVHFVSSLKSLRLDLKISEYVRATASTELPVNDRITRVGNWLCSKELLRWRLERSVFAEFAPASAANMQAELGKLAVPVLTRLFGFLRGPEFVRATQTSKYLHRLADSLTLWHQLLRQDYPESRRSSDSGETPDKKAAYISLHNLKLQRERARRHTHQRMLPQWARDRDDVGFWFLPPPPPPLEPPGLWVPPTPFQPVFPGRSRDPRWDLDSDSDLRLPFDRH